MTSIKNVISIHGVPRSGTSWVGQLLNSSPNVIFRYQPLFSFTHKAWLNDHSNTQEIEEFFYNIATTSDAFVLQNDPVIHFAYPKFQKSKKPDTLIFKNVRYHYIINNLLNNSNAKVIMILRHPCAVINSWWKTTKEFDPTWDIMEEWEYAEKKNKSKREEYYGFQKCLEFIELALNTRNSYPERVTLVTYQDLLEDPLKQTTRLFDFCSLPITEQTKSFVKKSTSNHHDNSYSIYKVKNKDIDWKESLDSRISNKILEELDKRELNKLF